MNTIAPITDDNTPLDLPAVERTKRNLRHLDALIEMGMALALRAGQEVLDPPAPVLTTEAASAPSHAGSETRFAKLARVVQLCMALQTKLGTDRTSLIRNVRTDRAMQARNTDRAVSAHKQRVAEIVGATIAAQPRSGDSPPAGHPSPPSRRQRRLRGRI